MRHPVSFTSAALAAALLAGVVVFSRPLGGGIVFADVRAAVAATGPVKYRVLESVDGREPTEVCTFYRLDADRKRSERPAGGPGNDFVGYESPRVGVTIVADFRHGEMMTLDHRKKTAEIVPIYRGSKTWRPGNDWNPEFDWLNQFRNLPEGSAERIGEREIDGRKVTDFLVTIHGHPYRAAIDSETRLPIRIEVARSKSTRRGEIREIFQDFEFDAALDEALFQTDPPPGFAVTRKPGPKVPPDDAADSRLVVSPETGIGPVNFGASEDEVVRLLGEPESAEPVRGQEKNATTLSYNARGFSLTVDDRFGLSSIQCLSQAGSGPRVRDFLGATPEGIRIGATPEEVRAVYGEPEAEETALLSYGDRGWQFRLHDGYNDDRVVSMLITPPRGTPTWRSVSGVGARRVPLLSRRRLRRRSRSRRPRRRVSMPPHPPRVARPARAWR